MLHSELKPTIVHKENSSHDEEVETRKTKGQEGRRTILKWSDIRRRFINKGYFSEKAVKPNKGICNSNPFEALTDDDKKQQSVIKTTNITSPNKGETQDKQEE